MGGNTYWQLRLLGIRALCSQRCERVVFARTRKQFWLSLSILSSALLLPAAHAEFAMNFTGGQSTFIVHNNRGIGGQTDFTPIAANTAGEYVIDPSNGLGYWHYILGTPDSGFAQEVYIRATGSACSQFSICSASGGTVIVSGTNVLDAHTSSATGNGTGNPSNVILRQILGGTWDAGTSTWTCDTAYCSEFLKAAYANKPKITQGMNSPDFTAKFILDMSGISLSDNTTGLTVTSGDTGATGASLTNVQTAYDALTGKPVSSFDLAVTGQDTYVNGGKYVYTPGSGKLGALGTYSYVDGSYDPTHVDYTPYLDPTVSNPWAYPANQP